MWTIFIEYKDHAQKVTSWAYEEAAKTHALEIASNMPTICTVSIWYSQQCAYSFAGEVV